MSIDFSSAILIFTAGIIVGFINTLSGGGSVITLPLLMFIGLDISVANGTNRIGILLQTITGILTFRKQKILDLKRGLLLSVPVILGALTGTSIAVEVPSYLLEKIIGIIFIILIVIIITQPKKWNKTIMYGEENIKIKKYHYFILFLIGIYGGFIQAGVGIFMLFVLVSLIGYDIIKANALKLFLTFIFTPFAIIIFWQNEQIDWGIGFILGAGSIIGAFVAAKSAIKIGEKKIKWLVIAMVLFSALYFILR